MCGFDIEGKKDSMSFTELTVLGGELLRKYPHLYADLDDKGGTAFSWWYKEVEKYRYWKGAGSPGLWKDARKLG
jgi:hypothetical protein